jgi:Tfp pilus assembly major pilin PilA
VVLPSLADWLPADAPEEARPCLERRIASLPSHLYFLQEGDYLLFASTPQPLIDRQYVTGRTPVREWLAKHQRLESDGALLLATTRTAGLPALLHDLNLQLLAFLGDLAGRPVDLFAFPTVRELGLPDSGAYGLRVGSTDAELSVELVFEHNPAEVLMAGSGYTGVVVAGVLAAIAVPAYQDYTVRSQVSEAVEATEPLRNFLAEFVLTNGRYPGAGELEQIDLSEIEQPYFSLAVEPGEGRILVTLLLDALEEANAIVLSPRIEEGGVVWECASEMPGKYLPDACR